MESTTYTIVFSEEKQAIFALVTLQQQQGNKRPIKGG